MAKRNLSDFDVMLIDIPGNNIPYFPPMSKRRRRMLRKTRHLPVFRTIRTIKNIGDNPSRVVINSTRAEIIVTIMPPTKLKYLEDLEKQQEKPEEQENTFLICLGSALLVVAAFMFYSIVRKSK